MTVMYFYLRGIVGNNPIVYELAFKRALNFPFLGAFNEIVFNNVDAYYY